MVTRVGLLLCLSTIGAVAPLVAQSPADSTRGTRTIELRGSNVRIDRIRVRLHADARKLGLHQVHP